MFTGIFNSGNLAVDTTASESAGNQNTGHVTKQLICIFFSNGLGIDPFDIYNSTIVDTAVLQCFYHGDVSVMKLNIFSNQCNVDLCGRMTKLIYHIGPVGQIRFRTRQVQTFAGSLRQMLLFHGKRCFIQIFHIQVLKNMLFRNITEQSNLVLDAFFQRKLGTAYNNIRLDSHTLQLFDRSLGWFGLHFAGCFQIRDQCDMDQDRIFMTNFMLELTDRLKEWLTFNITDCTAGLNDGDMHIFGCVIPIKSAFDFVGNVRNDLNGSAAVIAATLLLKNGPVYFSGGHIGILIKIFVDKTLVMSKIEVGFCAVIGHEYLTMLYGVHGAWVNVDIRVKFLHGYFVTARF